MTTKVGHLCEV